MTKKSVASIKKLARYEPEAVYIGAGDYVAECVRVDDGDYYLAADADAAIEALQAEIEALRRDAEEWMSFAEAQVVLRAEAESYAEELEKALAELITWIPSADIYRRMGFDPATPMQALREAKAVLGRSGQQ